MNPTIRDSSHARNAKEDSRIGENLISNAMLFHESLLGTHFCRRSELQRDRMGS